MNTTNRIINDDEFARFIKVGRSPDWIRLIDTVMKASPYGDFGFDGQPHSYSSKCCMPDFDEDAEVSPLSREFWNSPNRCDWTTPLFLHIAQEAMPEYNWRQYRHAKTVEQDGPYKGCQFGHTEVVGTDPVTADVVALGLNVDDIEITLERSNYPVNPVKSDKTVKTLMAIAAKQKEAA